MQVKLWFVRQEILIESVMEDMEEKTKEIKNARANLKPICLEWQWMLLEVTQINQ